MVKKITRLVSKNIKKHYWKSKYHLKQFLYGRWLAQCPVIKFTKKNHSPNHSPAFLIPIAFKGVKMVLSEIKMACKSINLQAISVR